MSTSSTQSRGINRRIDSLQKGRLSRGDSNTRKKIISHNDAYLYALRVAYLAYLLQPRARRIQHVPAPAAPVQRPSTSINDLMKDFSLLRESKSTRFPHGFMAELDKRLKGILMNKEQRAEYKDTLVKRTFAVFLNAFSEPSFQKRMEKDRRVEDLVLIFFSNATKELSKGKQQGDDTWQLMVDRHLALFIRLMSLVLRDHDWVRDRPELVTRLSTLESKLLAHDQDLSATPTRNGGSGGTTVEVVVPLSYDVKDMPLVQVVARIFGLRNAIVQSDIDKYKVVWTEKAALQDLKTYQQLLNLNSPKTLRSDDFDLDEAYEQWRKGEVQDLSQMIMAIMQSNPELAKSTTGSLPYFSQQLNGSTSSGSQVSDGSRRVSDGSELSSYVIDQPVDMSYHDTGTQSPEPIDNDKTFTFIPADARAYYRFILAEALNYDMNDKDLSQAPSETDGATPPIKFLSKNSIELLNEICLRWRIHPISRIILLLDVVRDKFVDQGITLDTLDAAFHFVKEPLPEKGRTSNLMPSLLFDRTKWILADTVLNQQILSALHVALLRDLYDVLQHCYESKPPSVGPVIYVLENHIYNDPGFSKTPEDLDSYREQLYHGLQGKAHEMYRVFLQKEVPNDQNSWDFFHVIELGKAVVNLAQRIQKRYRKNPEVMGVNPLTALVETILPLYAEDAKDIVKRILDVAKERNEEVPVEDGFQLYGELVEIRRIHSECLPNVEFAFHIEGLLADFVWRWISMTEASIVDWVDQAIKQDNFRVRSENNDMPTEDQRHSVSVIDIFSSFNQTIDKIVELKWDDDLQYAKFMTSLARVVGAGIARYCELLEQKFTKEMDRLTPEQEAARNQSTQEKWLSLAKDAWNNKEKIEPFQFFPEVCNPPLHEFSCLLMVRRSHWLSSTTSTLPLFSLIRSSMKSTSMPAQLSSRVTHRLSLSGRRR